MGRPGSGWACGRPCRHPNPVIPDSENYTLTFNDDGTVSIKADCNVAIGSYQLSGDQLTISLGPTTLAECGPESSYTQFLTLLEQAAGVGMGYGNLVITLANDAGEMFFQRATTSSLAADLEPVTQDQLVDILWQWVSLIETMPASQSMIADSENYNIVFRGGWHLQCQSGLQPADGQLRAAGQPVEARAGITTLAECGPDSSYDMYRDLLERVDGAGMREGVLVLFLADDAGIMNFENKGEAPGAAAPHRQSRVTRHWCWAHRMVRRISTTNRTGPRSKTLASRPRSPAGSS